MQKRWVLKISGHRRIIIRDVLDKIALWITKFKEIGDVIVQYDPTHAALPWAGVRFLLEVSTVDVGRSEPYDNLIDRMEHCSLIDSEKPRFLAAK